MVNLGQNNVGGVPHICKLLSFVYLAVFGISIVEWFTARNKDNIKEQNMLKERKIKIVFFTQYNVVAYLFAIQ